MAGARRLAAALVGALTVGWAAGLPLEKPAAGGQQAQQQALRTTILQTLINDPELGQYALAASVDAEFHVVLRGTLPSKADKDLATHLVKGITGVEGVDNRIQVSAAVAPLAAAAPARAATPPPTASGAPTPADVQTAVENALRAHPELAGVAVHVADATVRLSGTVASDADRKTALAVAKQNAAGLPVADVIVVKHPPAS